MRMIQPEYLLNAVLNKKYDKLTIGELKETLKIKIPETCGKCLFYRERDYTERNNRGTLCDCMMAYMDEEDMHGRSYENKKYEFCRLGEVDIDEIFFKNYRIAIR